jgi:hypothetical protein
MDFLIPTGDETAFAGDRGVVTAPSLLLSLERGLFFAGSQLGARFRLPVELGGARLGTQLVSSLGAGLTPVRGTLSLDVSLEAWLMPALPSATVPRSEGSQSTSSQIASEWLLSARLRTRDTTVALGGGTGLPLSTETRTSSRGAASTAHFNAVTSPRARGVLTLTHAFDLWPTNR